MIKSNEIIDVVNLPKYSHKKPYDNRIYDEILEVDDLIHDPPLFLDDLMTLLIERHCLVAKNSHNTAVGYVIYERDKQDHNIITMVRMAVMPSYADKGVGEKLIKELVGKATKLFEECRESNLDRQLFLSKLGFKALRPNQNNRKYFNDTKEDSITFVYKT